MASRPVDSAGREARRHKSVSLRRMGYNKRVNDIDANAEVLAKRDRLLELLRPLPGAAVAFSGGIDSTVVAKAAHEALGERAIAVTADSPSVPRAEIEDARRLAGLIGIRHRIVRTEEFANPDYLRNDGARCYYCKSELYDTILDLLPELGAAVV